MRPEPSTILRYLLQLGGSQALSSLEAHDIPKAARELGADVSAGQYLHPDLQETYLRYANSAVNNDILYEGNVKWSKVSKQVNQVDMPTVVSCTGSLTSPEQTGNKQNFLNTKSHHLLSLTRISSNFFNPRSRVTVVTLSVCRHEICYIPRLYVENKVS